MSKKFARFAVLAVAVLALSGCYFNKQVESNEVGLRMDDGVSITAVVGPGRYTHMGFYAQMEIVDAAAKTITWEDPDLVTRDKQPIGFQVGVTYARRRDAESAKDMWELYNGEARDDEALIRQVWNRVPRVAKAITTRYTLDEMLGIGDGGGREVVQAAFFDLLAEELDEIHVDLLDVGINNISPDPEYMDLLKEKANAGVAVEVAKEKTRQLKEQLNQEKAQTEINLEQARRENLVAQERAKVFTGNERWYKLQYLKELGNVFGENDKVWFLPPGTDLTLLLSDQDLRQMAPVVTEAGQ